MRVIHCDDYDDLTARATGLVVSQIERRRDLLLCPASGASPAGLYADLAARAQADPAPFAGVRIVKLDEWAGVPATHPGSCEHYLRHRLLDPLGVTQDRCLGFDPAAADPAAECERVRHELERRGPIDLCVLGLGVNGHVGFNEPAPSLIPHCHVATLSETSRRHAMAKSLDPAPRFGLTLGMREILASRKIVLLVTGEGKRDAATRLLAGDVSTTLPASLLWLHPDVECLLDRRVLQAPDPSGPRPLCP